MGKLFDVLELIENDLDDWIFAATPPTTAGRASLTPAQQAGLDQLRALRANLDGAIERVLAAEAATSADALAAAEAKLDGLSQKLQSLSQDLSTLQTVLQIAGTAVGAATTIIGGALSL